MLLEGNGTFTTSEEEQHGKVSSFNLSSKKNGELFLGLSECNKFSKMAAHSFGEYCSRLKF